MIEIKLSFNTVAEAVEALAGMSRVAPVRSTPSGTVAPKAENPVEAPKVEKPQPEPVVEKPKVEKKAAPAVDYADVKAAVGRLALIGAGTEGEPGRAAVKRVLAKLGLPSFQGSPEGCWGTALELLAAETAKLQEA